MFKSDAEKAHERKIEEQLYNQVAQELQQGKKHDATWAKALATGKGDNEAKQGLYIKYRVQSLMDDLIIEQENLDIQNKESINKQRIQQRIQQRKKTIDKVKDNIFVLVVASIVVGFFSYLYIIFIA